MKKLLCLCLATLLLCGCQLVQPDSTANTTEPTTQPTALSTETTAPSTAPTETNTPESTETTGPISTTPSEFPVRYGTYDWTAENSAWRTVSLPDHVPNKIPETITSRCEEGFLYVYNEKIGELRTIVKQTIVDTDRTNDHLYYILESEPGSVYRTDFAGEQHELVCQIHGAQLEIDGLLYYQDQLSLAIIISGRQAALYHIDSEKWTVFMEQAYILKFGFDCETDPYRLMICWHGRVSEDEEGTHPYKTYLDTGETVDWNYL